LLSRRRGPGGKKLTARTREEIPMKPLLTAALTLCLMGPVAGAEMIVVDFEDVPLETDSAWYGPFASRGVTFSNYFDNAFNYWEGFAVSSRTDSTASGLAGQFNAMPGSGSGEFTSLRYGVVFPGFFAPAELTLPEPAALMSVDVTNVSYAYQTIRDGNLFAKKFGGTDGSDPDWFKLTVTGHDAAGPVGSVEFYLADYRFEDDADDYIVDDWRTMDLSSLGVVESLSFSLSSTDNDPIYGMNTPGYFAIDNMVIVPEPASLALLAAGVAGALRRRRQG
jgi:hypothetical protein